MSRKLLLAERQSHPGWPLMECGHGLAAVENVARTSALSCHWPGFNAAAARRRRRFKRLQTSHLGQVPAKGESYDFPVMGTSGCFIPNYPCERGLFMAS